MLSMIYFRNTKNPSKKKWFTCISKYMYLYVNFFHAVF